MNKSWVTKPLSPEDLKAYTGFKDGLKTRLSDEQKRELARSFAQLVQEIASNLHEDPSGEIGLALAERCIALTNRVCGPEHATMRAALWQKGFDKYSSPEPQTSKEILAWIDKAMDAYWQVRIHGLVSNVEHLSDQEVAQAWAQILDDMCGDDQNEKDGVVKATLKDKQLSSVAKDWLRKNYNVKY